uniref:Uncharacterized protein n=1 Tax=Scylla olivacea TaxID=85551 RepID=A0A0P4VUB1_SCYOL
MLRCYCVLWWCVVMPNDRSTAAVVLRRRWSVYSGLGYVDDTSVNAIRLYCQTSEGSLTDLITSSEGTYGQWKGMRPCGAGEFMTGVRGNVVPDMGPLGDDLGVDNLQMSCSGGEVLDGLYGTPHKVGQSSVVAREITEVGGREMEAVHLKIPRAGEQTGVEIVSRESRKRDSG